MAKEAKTSRTYLKILGIIIMVMGIAVIASGIILPAAKLPLDQVSSSELTEMRSRYSDDQIRLAVGGVIAAGGLMSLLAGLFVHRAGIKGGKTTLALVLIVLNVISGVAALFKSGQWSSIGNSLGTIFNLAIYVLALMAIINVRNEDR